METKDLEGILDGVFDYKPNVWHDKVKDPEGDNSHRGTKWTARKGNNIEAGVDLAHDRLNYMAGYLEDSDMTQRNLRFEFLLLKASVTSGLTSNIFVDNFESVNAIELSSGAYNPELQRIYLP